MDQLTFGAGWRPHYDHRDQGYHVRELLAAVGAVDLAQNQRLDRLEAKVFGPPAPVPVPPKPPAVVGYPVYVVLDQGQTGECVGHGFAHDVASAPKSNPVVGHQVMQNPTAVGLYQLAQQIDGDVPDPESGTTTLAGAKAAVQKGYISSYHWCTSLNDVVNTLLHLGPVVVGTPWMNDMFTPDADHRVHATGGSAGGHCYLLDGYDTTRQWARIHNSWGSGWGDGGEAWISALDLGKLLAQQGDACFTVKT